MKIDISPQNYANAPGSVRNTTSTKPMEESRQPQQVGSAFSVSLSAQAQKAAAQNKVSEEALRKSVDTIREQLASGTYSISGKDVASKILGLLND